MSKAIFITDDQGPSVLWNPEGTKKLGEFQNSHDNILQVEGVNKRVGLATWTLVVGNDTEQEKENVKLIKAHPHYGKFFFESDSMPITKVVSNLRQLHDPNAAANNNLVAAEMQRSKEVAEKAEADKKVLFAKVQRFAVLSAKVQKAGGGIISNADPAEVAEFTNLKNELEIEENENEKDIS